MSVYEFSATTITGTSVPLDQYQGKVLLIVNTASKCGFTPQYKGLEALYQEFRESGFEVLGFPCDQFGHQEPGSDSDISDFCELNFGVTFPLFSKIEVNGDNTPPLYNYLKSEAPGLLGSKGIKWNFTKFLVDSEGKVLERFSPQTKPADIRKNLVRLLKKKA